MTALSFKAQQSLQVLGRFRLLRPELAQATAVASKAQESQATSGTRIEQTQGVLNAKLGSYFENTSWTGATAQAATETISTPVQSEAAKGSPAISTPPTVPSASIAPSGHSLAMNVQHYFSKIQWQKSDNAVAEQSNSEAAATQQVKQVETVTPEPVKAPETASIETKPQLTTSSQTLAPQQERLGSRQRLEMDGLKYTVQHFFQNIQWNAQVSAKPQAATAAETQEASPAATQEASSVVTQSSDAKHLSLKTSMAVPMASFFQKTNWQGQHSQKSETVSVVISKPQAEEQDSGEDFFGDIQW